MSTGRRSDDPRRELERAERELAELERRLAAARQLAGGSGEGAFRSDAEAARARIEADEQDRDRARARVEEARRRLLADEEERSPEANTLRAATERRRQDQLRREELERRQERLRLEADELRRLRPSLLEQPEAEPPLDEKQLALACTRWGVLASSGGMVALAMLFGAGLVWVSLLVEDRLGVAAGGLITFGLVIAVLGPVVLRSAVLVPAGRRALARERAWLAGLPFPVDGYERLLGGGATRRFEVKLRFATPPAGEIDLGEQDLGLRDTQQVRLVEDCLFVTLETEVSPASNARWRRPLRGLLEALRARHASHPIADVKIGWQ